MSEAFRVITVRRGGRAAILLFGVLATLLVSLAFLPGEAGAEECGGLQSAVDGAIADARNAGQPRASLDLRERCVYREAVTLDYPITINGNGASIRGSDLWTGWSDPEGDGLYVSENSVDPAFADYPTESTDPNDQPLCEGGRLGPGGSLNLPCNMPEQVFVDGTYVQQAPDEAVLAAADPADPGTRRFTVVSGGRLLLNFDPGARGAEVTQRTFWVRGATGGRDVVLQDIRFTHASNRPQNAALRNNAQSGWQVKNCEISYAHSVGITLGGAGMRGALLNGSRVHHNGQLGVSGGSDAELTLTGNEISYNNFERFNSSWSAGGAKLTATRSDGDSVLAEYNDVHDNFGFGIWTDSNAHNHTYRYNDIYSNERSGIRVEISDAVEIAYNAVYENGWGPKDGWGVQVTDSRDVRMHHNTLAWNNRGLHVLKTCRPVDEADPGSPVYQVAGVRVHDNTFLAQDYPGTTKHHAIFWQAALRSTSPSGEQRGCIKPERQAMFDDVSNLSEDNGYWYPEPEEVDKIRFAWNNRGYEAFSDFNLVARTQGDQGGYISYGEMKRRMISEGIPSGTEHGVDIVTPRPPTITDPAEGSNVDADAFAISGSAEAGNTVELFDGAVSVGLATADGDGVWNVELTGVPDGPHAYTARATDAADNVSALSTLRNITVEAAAPTVTVVTPPADAVSVDPGASVEAVFSEAVDVGTVSGTTFALVEGSANGAAPISADVTLDAAAKKATLDPEEELLAGATYTATIRGGASGVKDPSGKPLAADKIWSFTVVDTVAPPAPSIDLAGGSDTGSSNADGLTNNTSPTLVGTAEAGSTVKVYEGTQERGRTTADPGGNWSVELAGVLDGVHVYTATATDAAGNVSVASDSEAVTVDTTAPVVTLLTPNAGAANVAAGGNVEAGFGEKMEASTLTPSNFTLTRQGSAAPEAAVVTYDAADEKTVLNPEADLASETTYMATVKGGAEGPRDLAGNQLVVDKNWSFTTADATPPDTGIDSGPSGVMNGRTVEFAFSSTEPGSSFQCGMDGAALSPCTSPRSYSDLTEGSHTFEVHATDAAGNADPTPASRAFVVDATAPTVSPPAQSLVSPSQLVTRVIPLTISWSAVDGTGSGVARYELQRSTNGGAYAPVSLPSPTATSKTLSLAPGSTYRFQVRARDNAGNWSAWSEGPGFALKAAQENSARISYSRGSWSKTTIAGAYGGGIKSASAPGATATFVFTGNEFAWASTKGPDRGIAEVWVDGSRTATVDLYSASQTPGAVVFRKAVASPGSHTVEVRVLGQKNAASSGTRVDVDAFSWIG